MFGPVYGLVGPVYGSGGGSVKVEGGSVTLTGAANGAVSINGANVTHSTVTNDGPGLVPALPNDSTKFLDGKGNWSVINTGGAGSSGSPGATYSVVTSSKPGLVPALPSDGKKFLDGNGNWSTINAVTVSGGSGATYSTVTTSNPGLVPILPDDSAKFLDGKGNWSTISTGSGTSSNINLVSAKTAAGTVNTTSESGNTFINLTDNNNVKSSIQIVGEGNVSVSSSTAGVIKIFGSSTSTGTGTGGGSNSIVQKVSTANAKYPILLSGVSDATSDVTTDNVIFGSGIQVNPQDKAIIVGNKITIDGGAGAIKLGNNVLLDSNTANIFTGECSLQTSLDADAKTYYTGQVDVVVSNPKFTFQKGSTVTFKIPELKTNILANSQLDKKLSFNFGIQDGDSIKSITNKSIAYNAASMKDDSTYTLHLRDIPKDGYYVEVSNNFRGFPFSTNTFVQPIRLGGTGATTAEEARKNLGLDQVTGGGTGGGWARIAYDAGNITNSQYVISVTNDNLTLTMGTLMCIRFDNFKSSNDSTQLYINLNNTGNKKVLINGKKDAQVKDFADNYYYTFMYSGSSWVMSAYPKVPVELGGTGADNAQDALANLGISTVSSDMALQALGLDNVPPGVFICGGVTLSDKDSQQTFFNDADISPMVGFKLVPGVQVFIRNLYTSTYDGSGIAFNFNGTGKIYVATFDSAGTYKSASAADFTPGFYHAVYVDQIQKNSKTNIGNNVWVVSKLF